MKTIAPPSAKTAPVTPRTKQASRKGKKAWRRNVDITGEEEVMDDIREQERLGLGRVEDKTDDALFETDTKGDDQIRKKEFNNKKLRIDEILTPKSGIPSLTSRPRKAEPAKPKREFSLAEQARIAKAGNGLHATKKQKKDATMAVYDVWAEPPSALVPEDEPWAEQYTTPKVPETLRKKPKAAIVVPAVVPAPAGASYNPRFEDHQQLLRAAIAEEEKRIEQLRKLNEKAPEKKPRHEIVQEVGMALDAPSPSAADGKESEEESDEDDEEAFAPAPTRKLTKTERNRQQRRKEQEAQAAAKRREKELIKSMARLDALMAELELLKDEHEVKVSRKRKAREEKELGVQRLSKFKFEKPSMVHDVQLTEDLPDSLLHLKPEGNVMKDRFLSLQQRNMIEHRQRSAKSHKYADKVYEKRDYKEFQ
ncbi:hypothetical protein AMAG_04023 [Allomyces macrogynus ATCC 38327]|uniref:Ribosome biogenesis protein NOP53 n=1 Tax=Allomyces macrogynus (strain ATCC 38327) TaxID=578462 RepID=A0A0L0S7G4_ALLM3|nr:hypothetical protein AMAG_04023 [Allomyces macrogynus ATCC 38327]|eukprot:KNE58452.1 hypothetical protein AMAG_04023 [Allomyces macrogynus ATCC 38327]